MREVLLRVPRAAVEGVLDRLLPIIPSGVREVSRGAEVELRMRGSDLPPTSEIAQAAGDWGGRLTEHHVADDWRERRLADYEPTVIAGRLVVRPEWAPAVWPSSGPAEERIEIVLAEGAAFGAGTHPTTRTCLEILLELTPAGTFADLGCGTGVLAILAAKLGWTPVTAVDVLPDSVAAAAANAARNGVAVATRVADLSVQAPPLTDAFAANMPAAVHAAIARDLPSSTPRRALLSGFGPEHAAAVIGGYEARGLRRRRVIEQGGWTIALIGSD